MNKLIELKAGPPPNGVDSDSACGVNIHLSVPYGKDCVNLLINPSVVDYSEDESIDDVAEVKDVVVIVGTEDTKSVSLNLTDKNTQSINEDGKIIDFKLMNVGKYNFENKDWFTYEIYVSERE